MIEAKIAIVLNGSIISLTRQFYQLNDHLLVRQYMCMTYLFVCFMSQRKIHLLIRHVISIWKMSFSMHVSLKYVDYAHYSHYSVGRQFEPS